MKISSLLLLTALPAIVLTRAGFAQKPLHVTHGCAYKTAAEDTDLYTFESSAEAERIVSEICNVVGLSQNFDIRASNVENAMAVNDGSRRMILYSNLFLKKFNEDARTRWAAYSVLAHEIGHHLNNHDFGEPNAGKRKTMELEADRFSGSALRQLGASLDEAKAGVETFATPRRTGQTPFRQSPPRSPGHRLEPTTRTPRKNGRKYPQRQTQTSPASATRTATAYPTAMMPAQKNMAARSLQAALMPMKMAYQIAKTSAATSKARPNGKAAPIRMATACPTMKTDAPKSRANWPMAAAHRLTRMGIR